MANILVTGGAGYIGSHTCQSLAENGHTPITLDNLCRGHQESVKWGPLVKGSILDFDLLTKTLAEHNIEAVIHFAAYAYVGESVSSPTMYFHNNVKGSFILIEAMKACGLKKMVFSSSCATYGEAQSPTINEEHPQSPINPYGLSKLMTEQMLTQSSQDHEIDFCALRYFNAGGASLNGEIGELHNPEPHIIPNIIDSALNNRAISIFGNNYPTLDGTCVRDFIHVQDLANAHVLVLNKLLNNSALNHHFYNLGLSKGYSLLELVKTVENISQKKINIEFKDRRPGDPASLVASAKRFEKEFNWLPQHSDINTIIETAMDWKVNNHS